MRLASLLVFALLILSPVAVSAQVFPGGPTQLVPCNGPDCGTCELVDLVNNVVGFIVWFGTIAATLVLVYAGFRLVVSGGDVGAKTKAKTLFTNVVIGYVLLLSAYLIVNTFMTILLPTGSGLLNWNRIQCFNQADFGAFNQDAPYREIAGSDNVTDLNLFAQNRGYATFDDFYTAADNSGVCSESFLSPYFGSAARQAACISGQESTCGAALISRTDIGADGLPFSIGAFQINLTVHTVEGCAGLGTNSNFLDCKAAYSGRNYSARVVDQALYGECRRALLNPQCAAKNAARIWSDDGQRWRQWSTAGACRLN